MITGLIESDLNFLDTIEFCPLCGEHMLLKNGKYGLFWSCERFPKCKGSKNIERLPDLGFNPLAFYEPDTFLISDVAARIRKVLVKDNIPDFVKPLINTFIQGFYPGSADADAVRGKISGLLEYLLKRGDRFLLAQFAYFIYRLDGELPERFDYFLSSIYKPNSLEYFVKYKEYQIRKAIVNHWEQTPFCQKYGLKLIGEEIYLSDLADIKSNCKIDIVAKNADNDYALIEIKRSCSKSKNAWGQLHVYREMLREKHYSGVMGYIITSGYPRSVLDETIGLFGYTIQDAQIALIPWRGAKVIY